MQLTRKSRKLLKQLNDSLEEGCSISLNLFADGSGRLELYYFGIIAADADLQEKNYSFCENWVTVDETNHTWHPQVESIIEKLNKILSDVRQ